MGSKPSSFRKQKQKKGSSVVVPAPLELPPVLETVPASPTFSASPASSASPGSKVSPSRVQVLPKPRADFATYVTGANQWQNAVAPRSPLPHQTQDLLEIAQCSAECQSVASHSSSCMSDLLSADPLILASRSRLSVVHPRASSSRSDLAACKGGALSAERAFFEDQIRTESEHLEAEKTVTSSWEAPREAPRPGSAFGIRGLPVELMIFIMKFCHQRDLMELEGTSKCIGYCIHRDKFLHNYLRGRPESVRIRPRAQYPSQHLLCVFADRMWCTYGKADLLGMTASGETFTVFRGHEAPITSLVALGDSYLCAGSEEGSIKVWHRDVLLDAPFSAVAERTRVDSKVCSTTQNADTEDSFSCVECMTTIGDVLVTGSSDGAIRRFKVVSRELPLEKVGEIPTAEPGTDQVGHSGAVTCLASANGELFSASVDRSAIRWRQDGTALRLQFGDNVTAFVTALSVTDSPVTVITGESEGDVVQYSLDWVVLRTAHLGSAVTCLALHHGLLHVGAEDYQGFRQLDMYLQCVASFQSHDDVDNMVFFQDILFTGRHLGPLTKWIVLPPTTWPSRVREKRGLNRQVSAGFLRR